MLCLKNLKIEPLCIDGYTEQENRDIEDKIEEILMSWKDTPYMPGKSVKGRGVDCVHFITAIYDSLLGTQHDYSVLPQDMSFHNKQGAEAGLRRFFRMYPCSEVEGNVLQAGDIVICGPAGKNGGPGHGMIAGKHALWHVGNTGVCKAGLVVPQRGTESFRQIRRLDNRYVLGRIL